MDGCIFQDKNLNGDLNNIYEQDEKCVSRLTLLHIFILIT